MDIADAKHGQEQFTGVMEKRTLDLVGSFFMTEEENQQAQGYVRPLVQAASTYAAHHLSGATEAAQQIELAAASRIESASRPLQLLVEVPQDRVTSCRRVLPDQE